MTSIVINRCLGKFALSFNACEEFGVDEHTPRNDHHLVSAVRSMGHLANGPHAALEIVEVDYPHWHIISCDGFENVAQGHSPEIRRKALHFMIWRLPDNLSDAELSLKLNRSIEEIAEVTNANQ